MRFRSWHQCIVMGIFGGILLIAISFVIDPFLHDELNPPPKLGMRCLAAFIIGFLLGNSRYITIKIDLLNRLKKQQPFKKWYFVISIGIYYGFIGGTFFILAGEFILGFSFLKEPPSFFIFIYLLNILYGIIYKYIVFKKYQKQNLEDRSEP